MQKPVNCKLVAVNVGLFPNTKQLKRKVEIGDGEVDKERFLAHHCFLFTYLHLLSLFLCWCKIIDRDSWVPVGSRDKQCSHKFHVHIRLWVIKQTFENVVSCLFDGLMLFTFKENVGEYAFSN